MTCNFVPLKQILRNKGFTLAAEHAESVRWKIVQARYYSKLAEEKDSTDFMESFEGNELTLNDRAYIDSLLQCEAHTMCLAQILHSLGDITGHIVNESLLQKEGRRITKPVFYLMNVIDELDHSATADCFAVSKLLTTLKDSPEFQYLTAFVNTIKHVQLVDSQIHFQFTDGIGTMEGVRMKAFEYKQVRYGPVFAQEIYQNYLDRIEQYICAIVDRLIDVMK